MPQGDCKDADEHRKSGVDVGQVPAHDVDVGLRTRAIAELNVEHGSAERYEHEEPVASVDALPEHDAGPEHCHEHTEGREIPAHAYQISHGVGV